MKKFAASLLAVLLCFCALSTPVCAEGFAVPESVSTTAAELYFVNLDTGIPVVESNSRTARSIASLTKLMTCLLLIENVPDLANTMVTAPVDIYVSPITDASSSTADIRPNETVSALTLLYAMLLPSGNEAAAITAYYVGNGNMENFYAMMNARAAALGCVNTHFSNPHGLTGIEDNNYSCAYDLFLITQACWQYDIFRTACGSTSYGMPLTNIHTSPENSDAPDVAYTIYTTVKMMVEGTSVYRGYIKGVKTGSTTDAGRNYVSAAVNDNGETYLGVVLGCPWDPAEDGYAYSFHDTANIYDWLFANYAVQPTLDTETPATEVQVKLSTKTDVLKLYPAENMPTVLPLEGGADLLQKSFDVPESVDAPVKAGDVIGTVTLTLAGTTVGTVNLVAGEDVHRNVVLYAFSLIGKFFQSLYFRVVLVLTALFLIAYGALWMWLKADERRRSEAARRRRRGLPPQPQKGRAAKDAARRRPAPRRTDDRRVLGRVGPPGPAAGAGRPAANSANSARGADGAARTADSPAAFGAPGTEDAAGADAWETDDDGWQMPPDGE